jgi:hypothetical protein
MEKMHVITSGHDHQRMIEETDMEAKGGVLLGDDARKELRRIVVVGADVLVRGT